MNLHLPVESSIRVLIVDDHDIARAGIRTVLAKYPDVEIIDEAATGEQALELMAQYAGAIDVILMDIDMPGQGGILTTRQLKKQWPACKVVMLSGFSNYSDGAFQAGATGYVLKDAPSAEIIAAIHMTNAGKTFVSQQAQDTLIDSLQKTIEPLTEREQGLLEDLCAGLSNAKIAEKRRLSENTVREYVSAILKKLGVESRTQAVVLALRRGLVR